MLQAQQCTEVLGSEVDMPGKTGSPSPVQSGHNFVSHQPNIEVFI